MHPHDAALIEASRLANADPIVLADEVESNVVAADEKAWLKLAEKQHESVSALEVEFFQELDRRIETNIVVLDDWRKKPRVEKPVRWWMGDGIDGLL